MPRVKPLIKPDQTKQAILFEIAGTIQTLGITQEEMARRAGISPSTLCRRMKDIGTLRLDELLAIRRERKRAGIELKYGGE